MRDKTQLHISVPVVKDCRNPSESWNHMCTYCNKCGRWSDEVKKRKQVIDQLRDLIEDRRSFLDENGVGDEVFRADIEALEYAVAMLERGNMRRTTDEI